MVRRIIIIHVCLLSCVDILSSSPRRKLKPKKSISVLHDSLNVSASVDLLTFYFCYVPTTYHFPVSPAII